MTEDQKNELKRLVVFCCLMQKGNGIVTKAPPYLFEKYNKAMNNPLPEDLLDSENRALYDQYIKEWRVNDEE
jgi:hypothetical protein